MDNELKTKWLEALRGGKYEQDKEVLRSTSGGFCCLGVLADVAEPDVWYLPIHSETFSFHGDQCTLSPKVQDQLGISDSSCSVLMSLNDEYGYTFPMIADYIEEKMPNLDIGYPDYQTLIREVAEAAGEVDEDTDENA